MDPSKFRVQGLGFGVWGLGFRVFHPLRTVPKVQCLCLVQHMSIIRVLGAYAYMLVYAYMYRGIFIYTCA